MGEVRPHYESVSDRAGEVHAATHLESALGGRLLKLPGQYALDWALCTEEGEILKWLELKRRMNSYGDYKTFSISMSKVMNALRMEVATGIPAMLVVAYLNGLYVAYFRSFSPRSDGGKGLIRMGGRTDRNDPQDVEPMWHLPVDRLSFLCTEERKEVTSDSQEASKTG